MKENIDIDSGGLGTKEMLGKETGWLTALGE